MKKLVLGIQGDCQKGDIESLKRSGAACSYFSNDFIELKNFLDSINLKTHRYSANDSYSFSVIGTEDIDAVVNFMELMGSPYVFVAGKDWGLGIDLINHLNKVED